MDAPHRWLLGLALSGMATAQAPSPPDLDRLCIQGDVGSKLDRYLRNAEAFGFSGVVLAERAGELVLHRGYGTPDRRGSESMGVETGFDIGSIAKSMTAATALRVATEAGLELTAPCTDWMLGGASGSTAAPSVDQLLRHRGGLARNHGLPTGLSAREVRDGILEAERPASPGSVQRYSNGGYTLVASLLEGHGGWKAQLNRTLELAGLGATGIYGVPRRTPVARNYLERDDVGSAADWSFDWSLTGNGHVISTASDLYRWIHALESGSVIGKEAFESMKSVEQLGDSYALGLEVGDDPAAGPWYGHGGDYLGYHAVVRRFTEADATLVICCNEGFGFAGLGNHRAVLDPVTRILIGQDPANEFPETLLDSALGEARPGTYRIDDENILHVEVEGGIGWIAPEGRGATEALFDWDSEERNAFGAAWERTQLTLEAVRSGSRADLEALIGDPRRAGDLQPWVKDRKVEILAALPVTWSRTPIVRVYFRSTDPQGNSTLVNLGWRGGSELYDISSWDHPRPHAVRVAAMGPNHLVLCDYWTRRTRNIRYTKGQLELEGPDGSTTATWAESR